MGHNGLALVLQPTPRGDGSPPANETSRQANDAQQSKAMALFSASGLFVVSFLGALIGAVGSRAVLEIELRGGGCDLVASLLQLIELLESESSSQLFWSCGLIMAMAALSVLGEPAGPAYVGSIRRLCANAASGARGARLSCGDLPIGTDAYLQRDFESPVYPPRAHVSGLAITTLLLSTLRAAVWPGL